MATPQVKPPKEDPKGQPPSENDPTPTVSDPLNKPEAGVVVPLNFRVTPEFHREYKAFAAMNGMKMIDLFRETFQFYKEHKGS
ncbi:hypothetical protein [Endozoicomonas lisbonensis]|uniref:hypothetical protein n=1 Tax=Endozoicomonas lisbonensis TaxID=3120522 RepID=UPI003399525E